MTREIGKAAIDKLTGVTPKMFESGLRETMDLPANVIINDITLRRRPADRRHDPDRRGMREGR